MVFDAPEVLAIVKEHIAIVWNVPEKSIENVVWRADRDEKGEWRLRVIADVKTDGGSPYREPAPTRKSET